MKWLGKIRDRMALLFRCFFMLQNYGGSLKSHYQKNTENKDSVCVRISTHTGNSGRLEEQYL